MEKLLKTVKKHRGEILGESHGFSDVIQVKCIFDHKFSIVLDDYVSLDEWCEYCTRSYLDTKISDLNKKIQNIYPDRTYQIIELNKFGDITIVCEYGHIIPQNGVSDIYCDLECSECKNDRFSSQYNIQTKYTNYARHMGLDSDESMWSKTHEELKHNITDSMNMYLTSDNTIERDEIDSQITNQQDNWSDDSGWDNVDQYVDRYEPENQSGYDFWNIDNMNNETDDPDLDYQEILESRIEDDMSDDFKEIRDEMRRVTLDINNTDLSKELCEEMSMLNIENNSDHIESANKSVNHIHLQLIKESIDYLKKAGVI